MTQAAPEDETISVAALAAAAGDIHGWFFEELTKFLQEPRDGRIVRAREAISQLHEARRAEGSDERVIREDEMSLLNQVYDHVANVDATDPQIAEAVKGAAGGGTEDGWRSKRRRSTDRRSNRRRCRFTRPGPLAGVSSGS